MKNISVLALVSAFSTPALAEESRQLDAHVHGVGQLDIAIDGQKIALELHAPGADIVGFEYAAESDEDHAKIERALAVLSNPLNLFVLPAEAGCTVDHAHAELEGGEHDDHDDHDDHHAEHDDDHDHDAHHDEAHDEEHHDDEHEHEDEDDHDAHEEADGHSEFHAEYLLVCADVPAATQIEFPYFDAFENALEVEVQIISDTGATSFEVERTSPLLDLSDAL